MIILITGRRFSGKDSFADALSCSAPDTILRCGFADEIKRCYAEQNSASYESLLYNRVYKEVHRPALINFAETYKEVYGSGVWAKILLSRIQRFGAKYTIVSDWRFDTELDVLRDSGMRIFTIRVTAPDEVRLLRGWTFDGRIDNHQSEKQLDDFPVDLEFVSTQEHGLYERMAEVVWSKIVQ